MTLAGLGDELRFAQESRDDGGNITGWDRTAKEVALSLTAPGRAHMFELPDGWTHDDIVGFYRTETAAADAVLDAARSFDEPSAADFRPTTLRWVMVHLIEETARHLGHMDITRELLDGRTGR